MSAQNPFIKEKSMEKKLQELEQAIAKELGDIKAIEHEITLARRKDAEAARMLSDNVTKMVEIQHLKDSLHPKVGHKPA